FLNSFGYVPAAPTLALIVLAVLLLVFKAPCWKHWRSDSSDHHQWFQGIPGPIAFPLIGNSFQLGSMPHLKLSRMAAKYGDVFHLKLGSRHIVVINGEETIREALVKHAADFAGRPDFPSYHLVSNGYTHFGKTVGAGSLVDVMPWLLKFPNPIRALFHDFELINRDIFTFIKKKVEEHRETYREGTVRDMIDAFIKLIESGGGIGEGETKLQPHHVESTLTDIFGASQDTLSTFLQWFVLLVMKYPKMQNRLQKELDLVVGRDRLPRSGDRINLPFTEAFMYEVLRYTCFVPITIPHATTTDTELNGFDIPKDTIIFINQWSVNRDPKIWKDPEKFWPERFLQDQSSKGVDRELIRRVLIFSAGRRRCVGEELAKVQLFLFSSILLHQLNFSPKSGEQLSLEGVYSLPDWIEKKIILKVISLKLLNRST
uniref:Cytochrome P450 family 1 subfamily B member 1 n=1 Tax=Eptatretus burgeri TaxID=7764 RepID=A0A8C4QTZ1_EPTBU